MKKYRHLIHDLSYSTKGIGVGCAWIIGVGLLLLSLFTLLSPYFFISSGPSEDIDYLYIQGLALVAGLIWTGLLLSLFPDRVDLRMGIVAVGALVLGWISTVPTLASMIWLDGRFNLSEGNDFLSAFLYHLFSVGLREELCKLLLFTPMLILVLRKNRELEALILGALVGLGFAIEENITYYLLYQHSGVAVSRFVSANFLHFTLTGVTALALTRALRDPRTWGVDFLQTLIFAIFLHAIYNALLSQPIPGFGEMSYFSGSALTGCAYLFFREVHTLSPLPRGGLSRTALFCWGFCLICLLELLLATFTLPFDLALYLIGQSALAGVFTGYIFVQQVRESLAP